MTVKLGRRVRAGQGQYEGQGTRKAEMTLRWKDLGELDT